MLETKKKNKYKQNRLRFFQFQSLFRLELNPVQALCFLSVRCACVFFYDSKLKFLFFLLPYGWSHRRSAFNIMYIKRNIKWISFIVLFAFIILFRTKRRRRLECKVKSKYCFSITRTYTLACTGEILDEISKWKWVSSLCSMQTIFYSMAWKKYSHTSSAHFFLPLSLS